MEEGGGERGAEESVVEVKKPPDVGAYGLPVGGGAVKVVLGEGSEGSDGSHEGEGGRSVGAALVVYAMVQEGEPGSSIVSVSSWFLYI